MPVQSAKLDLSMAGCHSFHDAIVISEIVNSRESATSILAERHLPNLCHATRMMVAFDKMALE